MKTFNKRGDGGETSLLYGGRVAKSHPRTEAYGTVDEAVSALGLARALTANSRVAGLVQHYQKELFLVGAEMATDLDHHDNLTKHFDTIGGEQVDRIEALIAELEAEIAMPDSFIIPGDTPAAAALDLARTVIRRCERKAVELHSQALIRNEAILAYLNRLADLTFTLARYEEQSSMVPAGRAGVPN